MEGTLSEAIQAVSTMTIVEEFGIPFQRRNGKTYLICPGHDDQHFGSCYIDKKDNGYYCYACNEHVQKWDMLLKVSKFTHKDAANWFFEKSGITPSKTTSTNPLASINKLIARLQDYVDNSPVYNDVTDCTKLESSYGRNINGDYLLSEVVEGNPLLSLYKLNKELFKTVVLNILTRREEKLNGLIRRKMSCISQQDLADGVQAELSKLSELKSDVIQM